MSPLYARYFDWESYPHLAALAFLQPPGTRRSLESFSDGEVNDILAQLSRSLDTWLPGRDHGAGTLGRSAVKADTRGPSLPEFAPGELHGVPTLPQDYQPRADLLEQFKTELLGEGSGSVAITTGQALGLHGSGGTGKSVMAAALAYDADIRQAFPQGIYWVTVGEARRNVEAGQQQLADWIGCDISHCRTNRDRREELLAAFAECRCLVIVDDVWSAQAAVLLDISGPYARVVYTTRHENLLSHPEVKARPLVVSRYAAHEALAFLAQATGEELPLPPDAERVALFTNGVVLSLSLAAGAFRHGLGWADLARRFHDSSRLYPDDLDGNLRAMTVGVSMLTPETFKRYCDLVVFPRDTLIPVETIHRFWTYLGVGKPDDLLMEFHRSGLLQLDGPAVRFHDDQLFYLQATASAQVGRHADLLESFRTPTDRWSDLDPREPYMWDHLVDHLIAAVEMGEAEALACDVTWIARRWAIGSAGAVEHDMTLLCELLELSDRHRAQRLRRRLAQVAHLFASLSSTASIANTLAIFAIDVGVDVHPLQELSGGLWLEPSPPSVLGSDSLVKVFSGHKGAVNAVVGLALGVRHRIASGGSDSTVRIWDQQAPDSESIVLAKHRGAVRSLTVAVLHGNEWLVSAGDDRHILLWDLEDLEAPPFDLHRHTSSVLALAALEGSDIFFLASGGEDRTVRLWYREDLERPPLVLQRHTDAIVAITAGVDEAGIVLGTASRDGKRILWRETSSGLVGPLAVRSNQPSVRAGACVLHGPDGLLAASSNSNGVLLRHIGGPDTPVRSIGPLSAGVSALATVPRGEVDGLVIGCDDGAVHRWDWSMEGDRVQSFRGHTGAVHDVSAITADGLRLVSASEDASARVWDPSLGDQTASAAGTRISRLTAIAITPNPGARQLITAAADRRIAAWDVLHGSQTVLYEHSAPVRALDVFGSDTRHWLTLGDDNGQAWIVDLRAAEPIARELPGAHVGPIRSIASAFRAGRWYVVSAGHDRQVHLRAPDGTETWTLAGRHSGRILDTVTTLVDGSPIVVTAGADGRVQYWEPFTARSATVFTDFGGPQANALCCFDLDDVPWLAAGLSDGGVDCWPVETPEERLHLARESASSVVSLAWLRTCGGVLAVLDADAILEVWEPRPARLLARVRVGDRGLAVCSDEATDSLFLAYDAAWLRLQVRRRAVIAQDRG